jgi:hypothetical protein
MPVLYAMRVLHQVQPDGRLPEVIGTDHGPPFARSTVLRWWARQPRQTALHPCAVT